MSGALLACGVTGEVQARAGGAFLPDSARLVLGSPAVSASPATAAEVDVSVAGPDATHLWTVSVSGLPDGVTPSLSAPVVTEGQAPVQLQLLASSAAKPGTSTAQVTATFGSWTHTAPLVVTITSAPPVGTSVGVLGNGEASAPLSVVGQGSLSFVIAIPSGATNLRILTSEGVGSLVMRARHGGVATAADHDCEQAGSTGAACDVAAPLAGTWSVVLVGAPDFSDVTLTATWEVRPANAGTGGGVGGGPGGGSGGGTGGGAAGGGPGTGGGATGGGLGGGTGGASAGQAVGPRGGTVGLMHFAITGDTRPPNCEDTAHYPTPIINAIADAATRRHAQFGLDLGDHMYVCNGSLPTATDQMNLYMGAVHRFAGTWFMTMGNHECFHGPCLLGSTNANYVAYMQALAPIATKPYYSFNVETAQGRATFVVIADNAWDTAQETWLKGVLTDADAHARYTIVARHHPEGDTTVTSNPISMGIVRQHKFALLLTGHNHSYRHQTTDNGRDLVLGTGGAPLLAAGSDFNGYAMIDQQTNGNLQVTVFNVAGDLQQDQWAVGPNP